MSIREDVELYTKLSGEDGSRETIGTIGAYLRGYRQGKENAELHSIKVNQGQSSDMISRQAAIDIANNYLDADGCNGSDVAMDIVGDLIALPSAEPQERKTGRWVYQIGMIKCDQCLRAIRRIDHDGILNFCPNCGCKMGVDNG